MIIKKIRKVIWHIMNLEERVGKLEKAFDLSLNNPFLQPDWECLAFNQQKQRTLIIDAIIRNFEFQNIVETGTWAGITTAYLAKKNDKPVYSCEIDPRIYRITKQRLENFNNITLYNSDSRAFLRNIEKIIPNDSLTFFYLDAHWYNDLPLTDELNIIGKFWKNVVIVIDDFQNPLDDVYGYDNYGKNKELTLNLIKTEIQQYNYSIFFIKIPAIHESGGKRGCVILTSAHLSSKLVAIENLVLYKV